MPTYTYECSECGHGFERFQSITEGSIKECPECKGKVKKLISTGAGFIFKGTGFYQTDYKPSGAADGPKPCEKTGKCPGTCG
ncbi:MAG: zinc ribbon domain-containing protein [Candidatus Aadella gelida]|nr:zinc ribbon domain-containing protein [Candidatus Aadella gelida]